MKVLPKSAWLQNAVIRLKVHSIGHFRPLSRCIYDNFISFGDAYIHTSFTSDFIFSSVYTFISYFEHNPNFEFVKLSYESRRMSNSKYFYDHILSYNRLYIATYILLTVIQQLWIRR